MSPYTPFRSNDQFRLLLLQKGRPKDKLRCELILVSFATVIPPYVAISYAWGDPAIKYQIECNRSTILGITENVKVMLEHLRQPNYDSIIWVDAICIDQSNTAERGHQVMLMGQIYSKAESVTIWLGPESDDSALLESFLPKLWIPVRSLNADAVQIEDIPDIDIFALTATNEHSPEWSALGKFFQRPWFSRAWVIQELVLGVEYNFLCGQSRYAGIVLSDVAKSLNTWSFTHYAYFLALIGLPAAQGLQALQAMAWARTAHQLGILDFVHLIVKFWDTRTSDPKDKIFAFLGLNEVLATQLQPDYGATIRDVYKKATVEMLDGSEGLNILCFAGIGRERSTLKLPSWVPDFSAARTMLPLDPSLGESPHRAGIFINDLRHRHTSNGNQLRLQAIKIDTISVLGQPLRDSSYDGSYIYGEESLRTWFREATDLFLESKHIQTEDIQLRILLAGQSISNFRYSASSETWKEIFRLLNRLLSRPGENWEKWRKQQCMNLASRELPHGVVDFLSRLNLSMDPEDDSRDESEVRSTSSLAEEDVVDCALLSAREHQQLSILVHALLCFIEGRLYCLLSDKSAGLVPIYSKVGDTVCVIAGAHFPYVIRPSGVTEDATQTYALVGECYIEGMMQGEAEHLGREFEEIVLV